MHLRPHEAKPCSCDQHYFCKNNDEPYMTVVVIIVDFCSRVSPPSLNCLLASCPSTLILVSALGGVIPAKNPIHGCQGRPERTYSMVSKGAVAIGS